MSSGGSAAGFPGRSIVVWGLAHAVAIVLISHCLYFVKPPSRQLWFWLELALACAAWGPSRAYISWFLQPTLVNLPRNERIRFVALSSILGILTTMWWTGQWGDDLWVHKPWVERSLRFVLGLSQAGLVAAGFAGLLAFTVRISADHSSPHHPTAILSLPRPRSILVTVVTFLTFLLVANTFTVWYIGQERVVYYWDYMTYWVKTAELGRQIGESTPDGLWDNFRHATQTDDYGPIPALPPAVVTSLFGGHRIVYVLAVVNIYLASLAVVSWLFVRKFAPQGGTLAVFIPTAAVLLSTVAWIPILRGYLDIGGAVLGTVVLLVYLSRPSGCLRWTEILAVGGLLATMALFRRWYSYSVVAFLLLAGVDTGLAAARSLGRGNWRDAVRKAGSLAAIGVWAAGLVCVFATPWVRRVLTTDYANDYAAYQSPGSLRERAWIVIDNCGPAHAVAILVSLVFLACSRETRRVAFLVGCMPPIMLWQMLKTADPGPHHYYLFLPAYILLPSTALARVLGTRSSFVRWSGVGLFVVWGIVATAAMFLPATRSLGPTLRPATSPLYYPPMTREDLPEMIRLLRAAEAAARTDDLRVAVVASSHTINPTMFWTADQSLGQTNFSARRVILKAEVDRVSGFPVGVFEADLLVVAWPPQTHLRPEEQQVVVVPARQLYTGTGIGKAFDRLPGEYPLADGVTAYLYVRARQIEDADMKQFSDALRLAHPTRPAVFTPPPGLEKWLDRP